MKTKKIRYKANCIKSGEGLVTVAWKWDNRNWFQMMWDLMRKHCGRKTVITGKIEFRSDCCDAPVTHKTWRVAEGLLEGEKSVRCAKCHKFCKGILI